MFGGVGIFYLLTPQKDALEIPLKCDLNVEDCNFSFRDRKITITLEPKPIQALKATHLRIENLESFGNLELKIYGLNMFMGEMHVGLKRLDDGSYGGEIFPAACFLDTMRFRAELLDGTKPLGFYFDFEVHK